MFNLILALALTITPVVWTDGTWTVDGMDGTVTLTDILGNTVIVPAACARVIVDSDVPNLVQLHTDPVVSTPEYVEACFA